MRFGYAADNTVEIHYSRFFNSGTGWREGHQRRRLVLAYNDQCCVEDVVMEIKHAAEALGILFDVDATLTVEVPMPPAGDWRYLAEPVAKRLGWKLVHPFEPLELSPWAFD